MQNSAYTKTIKCGNLSKLSCFIYLLKTKEKLCSYGKCGKIKVLKKLDQVITKTVFVQTIPEKIFETK